MSYLFRGQLCALICAECPEKLSNVKVRLYRSDANQKVTALAVANPKDTFAVVSDDELKRKAPALLAEAVTDSEGRFTIELDERKNNYQGEAFELDVYCETLPNRKKQPKKPPKPRQFTITTLQPLWRETENGFIWVWDYCLPNRFWCAIMALFDAWTICGQVTVCNTQQPQAGVKVTAFDADWITDDGLGSNITDANGKFRIDYVSADFKVTFLSPIFNIEVPIPPFNSGPDVYFKIETLGGTPLLTETRPRGQQADRANVGNCFCVDLCLKEPVEVKHAWFTHVGDFHIYSDIRWDTDGKTRWAAPVAMPTAHGGPNFGFYDGSNSGLKLRGDCPATHPAGGEPMRYRFLYEHPANPGVRVPLTNNNPTSTIRISSAVVGTRPIMWDVFGTGAIATSQTIIVAGSGATPASTPLPSPLPPSGTPWGPIPNHVIVPDADGWVTVDPTATNGGFSGPLILFVSSSAVPGGDAGGNGAGNAPTAKNGTAIKLIFEAEPVGGATGISTTLTNELPHIFINNFPAVTELDIAQFGLPGADCCSPLATDLDVRYTADHELMRSWGVGVTNCSPGSFTLTPPPPGGSAPRGGFGTYHQNIAGWPGCSYVVTLGTQRRLTDGEHDDTGVSTQKTFCIDRP